MWEKGLQSNECRENKIIKNKIKKKRGSQIEQGEKHATTECKVAVGLVIVAELNRP